MSNYRLIYFNVKALGELPRYVFHAAGKKFQDVRIDSNDWLNLKKEAPFGQLPILEVHNGNNVLRIAQSNTITRYLSRQFGLAGKNEIEQVKAEMILEYFTDLHVIWRVGHKETNDELKKEKFKQFAENTLPNHLNLLEKILKAQNTQYLVSNELTVADLCLAVNLDRYDVYVEKKLENFPLLKLVNEKVIAHPNIAAYKETRPNTAI